MVEPPLRSHISRYALPAAFPVRSRPWVVQDAPITRLHGHQQWEFGICLDGQGVFHLQHRVEPFTRGCAVVIPPGCYHFAAASPGTVSPWCFVHADGAVLAPELGEGGPADGPHLLPPDHLITGQIRSLVACLDLADDLARTAARGLIQAVIAMVRHRGLMPVAPDRSLGDWTDIVHLIDARLADRLSLADLATAAGVSCPTFTRRFRARFACSPGQWIQRRRLDRAADLLRLTALPVAAVARAVGMPAVSGFERHFRARFGQPPASWRRSHAS